MEKLTKRFMEYVKLNTEANDNAGTIPSSVGQWTLARLLEQELINMGLDEVSVDQYACVTAKIPGNLVSNGNVPTIGFIAHLDTAPEFSGKNVKPLYHRDYQGGVLIINEEKGVYLTPDKNPELVSYIGHDLITSDGTTLLGGDDKAGIAIIMDAIDYILHHPEVTHGPISLAFTPDEEVSVGGASVFDVEAFGADFAYTVDGEGIGEFNFENFNAAEAIVEIAGVNIHPGEANGIMVNAASIAWEFNSMIPENEVPEQTEGYDGFFHLYQINGNVESASVHYLIRDFSQEGFHKRKAMLEQIKNIINQKHGGDFVKITINDEYYNMKDALDGREVIIENALMAYRDCGIEPKVLPIRGGTDGSTLSFKGLPSPNIFMGVHNAHSAFEYVSVQGMIKARNVLVRITQLFAEEQGKASRK